MTMRKPLKESIETLFPVIVQQREYGSSALNNQLFDLVKKLQSDRDIDNKVSVDSITTVGGYQPNVVLHEHCKNEPAWQQLLGEIIEPSVAAYMDGH